MKAKISSLADAQKRLVEAMDTVREVATYLDGVSITLGISTPVIGARTFGSIAMPDSMSDRVIKIIFDANKPLKPKEIVNRYQLLGWTEPAGGRAKLYEAISGSLSYLLNRKQVLDKTKRGYSIRKEKE